MTHVTPTDGSMTLIPARAQCCSATPWFTILAEIPFVQLNPPKYLQTLPAHQEQFLWCGSTREGWKVNVNLKNVQILDFCLESHILVRCSDYLSVADWLMSGVQNPFK